MSASELQADMEQYRREVIGLKADYRIWRQRLETLAAEYESSKKFNPAQRYPILKDMIKDVCTEPTSKSKPP